MSLTTEQALPMEPDTMVATNNTNSGDILDQCLPSSSPSLETSPLPSPSETPLSKTSPSETAAFETAAFEIPPSLESPTPSSAPATSTQQTSPSPITHKPSEGLDGDATGPHSPSDTLPSKEAGKKNSKNDWVVDSIVRQRVEILNRYLPWALAFYRHLKATQAGAWTDELQDGVAIMMDLSEEVARQLDKLDTEGKHLKEMEGMLNVYERQNKAEHARARTLVRGRATKAEDLRLASLELDELNTVKNKIVTLRRQLDKSKIKYETEKSHLGHLKVLQRQYGRIFQLCGVEVCRIGEVN